MLRTRTTSRRPSSCTGLSPRPKRCSEGSSRSAWTSSGQCRSCGRYTCCARGAAASPSPSPRERRRGTLVTIHGENKPHVPLFEHMKNAPMHLRTTNHHVCSYFFCVCACVYIQMSRVFCVSSVYVFMYLPYHLPIAPFFFLGCCLVLLPLSCCVLTGEWPQHTITFLHLLSAIKANNTYTLSAHLNTHRLLAVCFPKKKKVHQFTTSNHGNCVM